MDIKPIARSIVLSALFLIPFIPLYVANGLFFPFITGKAFAFRVLVEVAFFSWIILAVADPKYRPKFSWPLAFLGTLTVWMAVANAFGVNPLKAFFSNYERMDGWVTLVHTFALFVVAGSVLAGEKLLEKWWRVFLAGAALVVGYAFIQIFGWATINQGGVRVDSTFGNAAYLAAYLLFVIPIALWQASTLRGAWRWVLMVFAALAAVVLYFTATRGALVGFAAGTVVALALYTFFGSGKVRKITGIALIGVGVLIAAFIGMRGTALMHSEPTLARLSSISLADLAVRADIWKMAEKGIAERPFLGWGQEGFNQVFNTYYEPALFEQEPWFDRAHDVYLDWAVAGGIPAALLFIGFLVSVVWVLSRRGSVSERALLVAALVAYAVQGLVVFDNLFTYVALALLAAGAHIYSARDVRVLAAAPAVNKDALLAGVAPVTLAALLAVVYFVNVPAYAAAGDVVAAMQQPTVQSQFDLFEKALTRGSFATQEIREQYSTAAVRAATSDAPAELRVTFLTHAVQELQKEIARVPNDARLYVMLAQPFRAAGQVEQAVASLHKAQELSPKKQILLLEEGIILLSNGYAEQARDAWMKAYALDTSFDSVRIYAAAGEIAVGHIQEGKALLMEKFGTTAVDSDVLSYAYYHAKQFSDLIAVWEVRVAAAPQDIEKRFGLATAYALAGRAADARRAAEAIAKEFPGNDTRVQGFIAALVAGKIK